MAVLINLPPNPNFRRKHSSFTGSVASQRRCRAGAAIQPRSNPINQTYPCAQTDTMTSQRLVLGLAFAACLLAVATQSVSGQAVAAASAGTASGAVVRAMLPTTVHCTSIFVCAAPGLQSPRALARLQQGQVAMFCRHLQHACSMPPGRFASVRWRL